MPKMATLSRIPLAINNPPTTPLPPGGRGWRRLASLLASRSGVRGCGPKDRASFAHNPSSKSASSLRDKAPYPSPSRGEGSKRRRGLPEIAAEPAVLVKRLDAEHHPQIGADVERAPREIGELCHHASAADEIDIAIIARRVGRVGERVGGPGHHLGGHFGQRIILLRADRPGGGGGARPPP